MDWQSIIVALVVLAALVYVGRRGWVRVQSLVRTKGRLTSSCASACGGCDIGKEVPNPKVHYQILRLTKPSAEAGPQFTRSQHQPNPRATGKP